MKTATAIIGAGWGDEGKGMAVHTVAAFRGSAAGIVIRHNGGAQAGHTVQVGAKRHVFKHVGSGTFAGAMTFLSRFFVVNPTIFLKEYEAVTKLGLDPGVMADPWCPVTTPYDVMRNWWMEEARGDGRHGSCGVGFGTTIERHASIPLHVVELYGDRNLIRRELQRIRSHHVQHCPADWKDAYLSDALMEDWIDEAKRFMEIIHVASVDELATMIAVMKAQVIFEGAQGLMLDQTHGIAFPHLTRSNTGIKNAVVLCHDLGIESLEAIYMTRPYWTRHGAGPLPGEVDQLPFRVVDPTNHTNEWQGKLRFAPLDYRRVVNQIWLDVAASGAIGSLQINPRIGVSCLDQVGGSEIDAVALIVKETGFPVPILGNGPTADRWRLQAVPNSAIRSA